MGEKSNNNTGTNTESSGTTLKLRKVEVAPLKAKNPKREWRTWKFPANIGNWTLSGYSRAADRTFLWIPELKISLDCGYCRGRQPETVFLTHSHIDHSRDVAYMCQREHGMDLYCPIETIGYIENFIRAEIELNSCSAFDIKKVQTHVKEKANNGRGDMNGTSWRIHGLKGTESFDWGKGDSWKIQVFECIHAVPCLGYGFYQKRKKN